MRDGVKKTLAFAALALSTLAPPLAASDGKFDMAVATDSREAISHHETFSPATAKIYVIYTVTLPKAGKLKAVWMAEKVTGVAENSKFTESQTAAAAGTFMGAFSYTKPGTAWPTGAYRIDLFIDGDLEKSVRFQVK
jgi:hypothetical protein